MARPALLTDADGRVAGRARADARGAAAEPADLAAARLAAIVSSSDDAIVGKSLDGRVTSWNDGAARIFGWSAAEMIGQPITRIIPAELLPEEASILARLRRGERVEHFDTERVTKDGRRIAVSLTVSPIRDATGRVVGASKIARDITARKRAEATQRQLLEELNHRVKNTLATIQAIAAQSLKRSPSPEAFVRSFGGRVQALARVHDLLTAGEMAGAELGGDPRRRARRAEGDARAGRGRGAGGAARAAAGGADGAGAARARLERPPPRRARPARRPGDGRLAHRGRPRRGGGSCSTGASGAPPLPRPRPPPASASR